MAPDFGRHVIQSASSLTKKVMGATLVGTMRLIAPAVSVKISALFSLVCEVSCDWFEICGWLEIPVGDSISGFVGDSVGSSIGHSDGGPADGSVADPGTSC